MLEYPKEITERQVGNPDQLLAGWVGGAVPPADPIVIDYNLSTNIVIDEIFERIFSVPPHSHPSWPRR